MYFVYIFAGAALVLGLMNNNHAVAGLGITIFLVVGGWKLLVWSSRKTKGAISNAMAERRAEKEFQTNLRREVQREAALAQVRNQSTIELLTAQVKLIAAHKREGLNVEQEIYQMREKLMAFERSENSAMIDDLKRVLDDL